MNEWQDESSAINYYYDGDFPAEKYCRYPENFDEIIVYQGLKFDVSRYIEIAREIGGPVLELCCGTGRVAIQLAGAGIDTVGVDLSAVLLRQFKEKLEEQSTELQQHIELHEQDITQMSIGARRFPMAIIAFNSLLCLPDFDDQCTALESISQQLEDGGLLLVDIVNPLQLPITGDPVPKPFFTRRNPHSGQEYTRFAAVTAFDESQCQTLNGWYDELENNGTVRRRNYSLTWRPIFRFEIELMLRRAGFCIEKIEGGHRAETYTVASPRMFIHARKQADC